MAIPDLNVASTTDKGIALGTKIEIDGRTYRWFRTAASPVAAFASGQLLYHRAASGNYYVSNDISDCTNGKNTCACFVPETITTVPVSGGTTSGAIYFWGQTAGHHSYMKKPTNSVFTIGCAAVAHTTSDGKCASVAVGTSPTTQVVAKPQISKNSSGTTRFSGLICIEGGTA